MRNTSTHTYGEQHICDLIETNQIWLDARFSEDTNV